MGKSASAVAAAADCTFLIMNVLKRLNIDGRCSSRKEGLWGKELDCENWIQCGAAARRREEWPGRAGIKRRWKSVQ